MANRADNTRPTFFRSTCCSVANRADNNMYNVLDLRAAVRQIVQTIHVQSSADLCSSEANRAAVGCSYSQRKLIQRFSNAVLSPSINAYETMFTLTPTPNPTSNPPKFQAMTTQRRKDQLHCEYFIHRKTYLSVCFIPATKSQQTKITRMNSSVSCSGLPLTSLKT